MKRFLIDFTFVILPIKSSTFIRTKFSWFRVIACNDWLFAIKTSNYFLIT